MENNKQPHTNRPNQKIVIQQAQQTEKNGLGLTGFILAIISVVTGAIPILGEIIWFLGALFSIIGLFKKPRGFAIAGTIISFIGLIIIVIFFGGLATLFEVGGSNLFNLFN